jgi:hypothetical protein
LLNAEADIPVEDLLRLYHPELYSDSPEKPKPEKIRKKRSKEKPEKGSSDEAEDSKSKAEENDDQVRFNNDFESKTFVLMTIVLMTIVTFERPISEADFFNKLVHKKYLLIYVLA